MSKHRVVVTGLGAITPLGNTVEKTWSAILAGQSGVAAIDKFDASAFATQICAAIKNFDSAQYFSVKESKRMGLFVQYGLVAAIEAIENAGLSEEAYPPERIGIAIGSGIGGLPEIEQNHAILSEKGPRRISPFFIPGAIINMIAGQLSIRYGYKGPNIAMVTACTTGAHNIGYGARTISYGDADVMICGGAEMSLSPLGIGGFGALKALSKRNDAPEQASRPWDKDRDGFVMGEGAGVLVLEEYEHAKKRGAPIYAELTGFGMSGDGHHMTMLHPEGEGCVSAMQNALNDANSNTGEVAYINAHSTSTAGDVIEAAAIQKLFTNHLDKLAVSSTKSMTGHLLGAAGSVEAIFTVLAMRDNVAPPTINLDNPSEDWQLNLVPNQPQDCQMPVAMSNSFGFGGTNAALLFKKL